MSIWARAYRSIRATAALSCLGVAVDLVGMRKGPDVEGDAHGQGPDANHVVLGTRPDGERVVFGQEQGPHADRVVL